MNKLPYTTFNLPNVHLHEPHYVPPRTRDSAERERRHYLPAGTVLLEQQRDGLAVAGEMFSQLKDPADLTYFARTLGTSALNAGWYSYAEHAEVMSRRLRLPKLADEQSDWRQTHEGLRSEIITGFNHATELADTLVARRRERKHLSREQTLFGRQVGNLSLLLACAPLGDVPRTISAFDAQLLARRRSLALLAQAQRSETHLDTHASLAQLADQDSPLAVTIRRHAPTAVYEAFDEATTH